MGRQREMGEDRRQGREETGQMKRGYREREETEKERR